MINDDYITEGNSKNSVGDLDRVGGMTSGLATTLRIQSQCVLVWYSLSTETADR